MAGAGACFVAGTEVVTPTGSTAIEDIEVGDRVLSYDPAVASANGGEGLWVEVDSAPRRERGVRAAHELCAQLTRLARAMAVPTAMLAACDPAVAVELPAADAVVQRYDARTGAWDEAVGAELQVGDEYLDDERLHRVTEGGAEDRGPATAESLAEADATWVAQAAHRVPGGEDWVVVLGDGDEAGHWRMSEVAPGERVAVGGRVFEVSDADADGDLEVRTTGEVLGRAVSTFVRIAPEVIDAEVAYVDGTTDMLTGTPNHPFWVDAVRDYVPLGELEVGTVLHVQGGGEAILVSKTWRQGDFEVFDFEVQGLHNFYVRGEGSDAAGVLVHNSTPKYVIEDGVKRAKAVEQAKGPDACIMCEVYDDAGNLTDVKDIPVKDLHSPYDTLDLSSSKTKSRWEYAQQNVDNPNNPPPRVFEGDQGTPIPDVEIVE